MLGKVRLRLQRLADRRRLARHSPVIVLGTQKSGTSAVAHLPPAVLRTHQGQQRLAEVAHAEPRPFLAALVKEPYLVYVFDQVVEVFPAARFVFVVRDPRDTVRSVLNRLAIPGDLPSLDLARWPVPDAWRAVLEPANWGLPASAHYVDTLAARWNLATDVYLGRREELALIRYEDFVAGKLEAIDGLAARLGLTPVADVSQRLDLAYQPAGKDRGTPREAFFGRPNLGRIIERCGGRMLALGYAVDAE
jgi:hypothetical protein